MRPLQNSKGTTLVELMVSITLLAILSLAATTLIAPCVKAYVTVQQQTRAQTLADALVENLRLELETAAGELCFVNADATDPDTVYQSLVTTDTLRPAQGSALQYSVYPSHIALLDAGAVPELKMKQPDGTEPKVVLDNNKAKERAGYLHMRYYSTAQTAQDTQDGYVYGVYGYEGRQPAILCARLADRQRRQAAFDLADRGADHCIGKRCRNGALHPKSDHPIAGQTGVFGSAAAEGNHIKFTDQ